MERPWAATDFTCHNKELMQSNKQGKKKKKKGKEKETNIIPQAPDFTGHTDYYIWTQKLGVGSSGDSGPLKWKETTQEYTLW